jgi:alpha-tubulin suppressor-like RCC1 family protein
LGDGTSVDRNRPVLVQMLEPDAVRLGAFHACALESETVRCWGSNVSGQLATGDLLARSVPNAVVGLDRVEALAAGSLHTCVVRAGAVLCWGGNGEGQLGRTAAEDEAITPAPAQKPGSRP